MVTIKCETCGKKWKGTDERDAERKSDERPCKCAKEAAELSPLELLAKIQSLQKKGK